MYEVKVRRIFSASHALRGYEGNCQNVHGHNWEVIVSVSADKTTPLGLVLDFREIKKLLDRVIQELDHKHLNDLPAFGEGQKNPTTENLAQFIYRELDKEFSKESVRIRKVMVRESRDCSASYWEEGND